jgi:hypothetical protein
MITQPDLENAIVPTITTTNNKMNFGLMIFVSQNIIMVEEIEFNIGHYRSNGEIYFHDNARVKHQPKFDYLPKIACAESEL